MTAGGFAFFVDVFDLGNSYVDSWNVEKYSHSAAYVVVNAVNAEKQLRLKTDEETG